MTVTIPYPGEELELFANAHVWKDYWTRQAAPFIGARVFDVGSGAGGNLPWLARHGTDWTCIEPDPLLAGQLQQNLPNPRAGQTWRAIHGALSDMANNPRADTIIYADVLEHIEDDRAEASLAASMLNPGGFLIVLVPAHQWLYSPFDAAIGHYRRYDRASMKALAPQNLQLVEMRYLDSVGMAASMANRFLLKASSPTPAQIELWDKRLVPLSKICDRLLRYRLGKSLLAIWRRT
jgi:2-polyprenyl-3-methyl-5-hydroxy-6-metoxy-1,4-benzoquinol methylase